MRLQKFMADCGVASRRACETIITDGRVTVNGIPAVLGMSVEEGDDVRLDGRRLTPQAERVVLMLYKPRGVVSTSSDESGRKTVQAFVSELPYRLYNVGRLDLNSEGLLLLTNDGELANHLMHPRYKVDKTYRVVMNSYRGNGGGDLLTKGAGIAQADIDSRIVYQSPLDLRHYITQYIERQGTVTPLPHNNWLFTPEEWVRPAAERDRKLLFKE